MLDAADGHLDPAGTTHAYAKSARIDGAEIFLRQPGARAEAAPRRHAGTSSPSKGTIHAEHVVNCGGLWAREVGRMVGLELPVLAMEHMYLVTEEMPEVVAFNKERGRELPHAIDFKGEIYMRQERSGMLLGTYEKACVPWSPKQTPWDFGHELLPPDLDRIAPSLEIGFKHFPAHGQGRHQADHQRALHLLARRQSAGRAGAGPAQLLVRLRASWRASARAAASAWRCRNGWSNGDPGFDVWAMDVARFGEWATRSYTNEKVRENYSRRFSIRFPNEELPAARPQQTTPLYDMMIAQGAVMGDSWGLETPLWFAPKGVEPKDIVSFHRSNDFPHVKAEVPGRARRRRRHRDRQLRQVRVSPGPGAEAFLSRLMTNACRAGPPRADADAESARQADRRLHHRQGRRRPLPDLGLVAGAEISHALVRAASADDGSVRIHRFDMGLVGPVDRRAEVARRAAAADRRGCLERGLPVHGPPRDGGRQCAGA